MHNSSLYDYTIIGGGIVGIATALQLKQRHPQQSVLVLEKESQLAQHQTGRNSGVIHAGVYYAPGSLKADFCKRGARATIEFCRQHNIPFQQPGKLLVATKPEELQRMRVLQQRCQQNGIIAEQLSAAQLKQREPHICGLAALHVADSGIVDYQRITRVMAEQFCTLGGTIKTGHEVVSAGEDTNEITLRCADQLITTRFLISCAGLMADRLCDMLKITRDFAIIPFRGEYYQLAESKRDWVNHLIYPIPDPSMPFLGVHLTPMIDGNLTVGPNAILGWHREGYKAKGNFSWRDSLDMLRFPGSWQLARRNWRAGLSEMANSWSKNHYLKLVQRYCPGISRQDLGAYPTGIRAQAVMKNGELVQDFLFAESPRSLHVCNAPSPAATSAIPIGEHITELAARKLEALENSRS